MSGEDLSKLAGEKPASMEDELINMAGSFAECILQAYNIPADFAGLTLNVLRDPDTHRLEAIVISPVDMLAGKPFPRFDPVKKVREVAKPKIALVG